METTSTRAQLILVRKGHDLFHLSGRSLQCLTSKMNVVQGVKLPVYLTGPAFSSCGHIRLQQLNSCWFQAEDRTLSRCHSEAGGSAHSHRASSSRFACPRGFPVLSEARLAGNVQKHSRTSAGLGTADTVLRKSRASIGLTNQRPRAAKMP